MRPLTLLGALLLAGSAVADERILDYQARVTIAADSCMDVAETITVRAEGVQIRHGIYRDFPTDYKDSLDHRYVVSFDVLGAERDGGSEDWRQEAQANGVRVYLGNAKVEVPVGEHVYRLRYRTCRQLGFFADHDELFWNVTGNGWGFPIDAASADVSLPYPVPSDRLKAYGYTGAQGSREQSLEAEPYEGGARYQASRALAPNEGLSVALEFPKGVLKEPSAGQKALWLLHDNRSLLCLMIGLVVLWLYYGWAWRSYGRDPAAGVVMPLYEPPKGFSPASLRYIRRMGYDRGCLAAGLLGLAAKGWLDIEQPLDGEMTLRRTGRDVEFAPGEGVLGLNLLRGANDSLALVQSEETAAIMKEAEKSHRRALAADYETKYFFTHRDKLVPGWLISVLSLFAALYFLPGSIDKDALGVCFFLSIWSVAVYAIVSQAITSGRQAGNAAQWIFVLMFGGGELVALFLLGTMVGAGPVLGLVLLVGTNIAFLHWMKAPTLDGARLLDQIEGFRWYLGVAEKQELDSRYKPESRPELFSEYLPYAFALDVDQAWAKRFADALPRDQFQKAQPAWYHGTCWDGHSLSGFASGLSSSLSSAISSASSPPGSSSGSGGGSGGGGGGGGGGGW